MANYVSYSPTSVVAKAMFNFDVYGITNYRFSGTVNVSVSDSFTYLNYLQAYPLISSDDYTQLSSGSNAWTTTQLSNINLITSTYSQFINW
jgi:hypothetical protein